SHRAAKERPGPFIVLRRDIQQPSALRHTVLDSGPLQEANHVLADQSEMLLIHLAYDSMVVNHLALCSTLPSHAAGNRTGPHQSTSHRRHPSCPTASRLGLGSLARRTVAAYAR